jgi:tRNA (guanosine-2'-O-)-methyltransferase
MAVDEKLIDYLSEFVTPERRRRMEEALARRTRYLTVVLEDIYQSHNASAVLRSCDGLGIQDVHIIENRNRYQVNPDVALGTSQWLTLAGYRDAENNTLTAFETLRRRGYRIVATAPHRSAWSLEEFPVEDGPIALVLGNELDGLTDVALNNADEHVKIPMRGFVDSFNISVAAALFMHFMTYRIRTAGIAWQLSEEEQQELRLAWLRRSIRRVESLEAQYHRRN